MEISILMATFNPNPDYFKECIDSLEAQTCKDFELVVVDDCSSKIDVATLLEGCSFPYKIVRNEYNLGLAKSLNRGLRHCDGEFIARMDDDDVMMPTRLEKQLALAKEKPDAVIFSNAELMNDDGSFVPSHKQVIAEIDIKKTLLKRGNWLVHSSLFAKKEVLLSKGGYDERFVYAQDNALYLSLIDDFEFIRISENLMKYRVAYNRSAKMKKILSAVSCYSAACEYFSRHKGFKYRMYFWRRTVSLVRMIIGYVFKGR